MRLICPNCDAQYEVAEDAIPEEGRDVQCSSCGHAWYQMSPDVLAAQAAEAELFEAPEPAPPPPPEVALSSTAVAPESVPDDAPEPEALAFAPPPPMTSAARGLDDDSLALLREEAEREVQARSREGHRLEHQGDLGLEAAAVGRRAAPFKDAEAEGPLAADIPLKPSKGRDLLPDIEEINSTLRPDAANLEDQGLTEEGASGLERGRSFRLGFGGMLFLALLVVLLYVTAPQIGRAVPALAGVMDSYVAGIDALRHGLDRLMQQATARLQG